jgi:hypothetical protein
MATATTATNAVSPGGLELRNPIPARSTTVWPNASSYTAYAARQVFHPRTIQHAKFRTATTAADTTRRP